jgi:hypothetical protein
VFERGHTHDQLVAFDHQYCHQTILSDYGSRGFPEVRTFLNGPGRVG